MEWLRVVKELGAKRQVLAVPKSIETGLQNRAVVEFLCQLWKDEERKRRRREKWALPVICGSFLALIIVTLGIALWTTLTGMARPKDFFIVALLVEGIFFWTSGDMADKRSRQRSLAFLLTNAPVAPPAAVLIEALHFGGFSQDARSRLVTSLPDYQDSDVPAFDEHQNSILLSELKSGLAKRMRSGRSYFTDTDITFLAVLIRWFEREAISGKSVSKEVMPLLSCFVQAKPRPDPSMRWRSVRTAAENYLLRVGELRSSGLVGELRSSGGSETLGNPAD